ncbi:MAG: DUF1732 domain-containing protein, partial [Amoebophilaceae bacterium]|nr:DUF1732 domain-containing protein [Amoebophilaceae bacterium]
MIKSMTGYGKADYEDGRLRASVEVKAINSKHADITFQLPREFAAQELAWRNLVVTYLKRGRVTLSLAYERKHATSPPMHVNRALFKHYYHALQSLAEEVDASSPALFQLAVQFPEVITQSNRRVDYAEDLQILEKVIQDALQQCDQSRQEEGTVLANRLLDYLQDIYNKLKRVENLSPVRSKTVREKLQASIQTWTATHAVDENRLEQELIYYLERLDVTEEQVRLAQHLSYFEEIMKSPQEVGRKLGFIAQEIG